jgi:hypothetical protein
VSNKSDEAVRKNIEIRYIVDMDDILAQDIFGECHPGTVVHRGDVEFYVSDDGTVFTTEESLNQSKAIGRALLVPIKKVEFVYTGDGDVTLKTFRLITLSTTFNINQAKKR